MNILQWWSLYCRCQIRGRSSGSLPFIGSVIGGSAIALMAPLISQSVWAATLSNWSYNPDSQEFQVTLPEGITPRYFLMAEPARIVIDLPGVEVGAVPTQASYAGPIRQIRVAQFESGLARVVIELAPDTVLEPRQAEAQRSGDQWILRPLIAGSTAPMTPIAAQAVSPEVPESTASATVPAPATTPNLPAAAASTIPSFPNLDQPVPTPTADSAVPDASLPTGAESSSEIPSANVSVEDDLTAEIQGLALPVNLPPEMTQVEPSVSVAAPPVETPLEASSPAESGSNSFSPPATTAAPEAAVPIAITVPAPPPSPVATQAVEAEAAAEAEEDVVNIPVPTLSGSEPDAPLPAPPTRNTNAQVAVPALPAVEAGEAAERIPAVPTAQAPVQTVEPAGAAGASTAIAQQPEHSPTTSDLPAVSFPAPSLPSGSGQIRVPAPTAPRVQPVPAPAANLETLDTTEATGSAADLVLPATGITTQRPGGFSSQSITQTPVSSTEVVRVPDLPPLPTVTPAAAPAQSSNSTTAQVRDGAVTFGQPLPEQSPRPIGTVDANVWLPADTVLKLQYPRDQALTLDPQVNWQEVLVLSHDVLHPQTGQVILATGTQIVGRFEAGRQGSRFIAQAVSIGNRNVRLAAESESIDGDRTISNQELLRNSGIGAAAATVIGGFSGIGLLAGIAAGAATTYITAPQPAVIQPYQVIEVRVLEDVTHSEMAQIQ